MGLPAPPHPSALQSFLLSHDPLSRDSPHPPHLHHLALQIAHNLRYQHGWRDVRIHFEAPKGVVKGGSEGEGEREVAVAGLSRPLLSGLPPKRLYMHPDEQVERLRMQKWGREEDGDGGETGADLVKSEREWVLPSHLREKWTLRRFGEVFDALTAVPGRKEGEDIFGEVEDGQDRGDGEEENEWRVKMPKRLLLATLDDDSTVVYYIVHDGVVKPRQN